MIHDSVTYQGVTYSADYSEQDRKDFDIPCASYGTRRCAINVPHTSLVHLVMGLAEVAGTVA